MCKQKLLHPFAHVMGVYFPVGKLEDGGTCEFATEKCLKECIACNPDTKNSRIPYGDKLTAYDYFISNTAEDIAKKIIGELIDSSCKQVSWFASGDCPRAIEWKVLSVMLILQNSGIIQCGFTRNRKLHTHLYFKRSSYSDIDSWSLPSDLRIVLTVEDIEKARGVLRISDVNKGDGNVLMGCPDYREKKVNIYIRGQSSFSCYDNYFYSNPEINMVPKNKEGKELNCKACYEKKQGCFVI